MKYFTIEKNHSAYLHTLSLTVNLMGFNQLCERLEPAVPMQSFLKAAGTHRVTPMSDLFQNGEMLLAVMCTPQYHTNAHEGQFIDGLYPP